MSKCTDNVNGKDLELLYNNNYIMDVKKIDKSNGLFAIKTFDAELNKSQPITVDENGAITIININSGGKYYSNEPPNIIIKPPASSGGTPAKARATMVEKKEGAGPNENSYWEIKDIVVDSGGSKYDAIADIDKVEIEKKNTVQKKIVYNEAKPKYYLLEKKQSQCNNLTDRWHDWFTIPYYYLGNNNGRRKIDESDKTRKIFKCYNSCTEKYVVNNDNVCESIQTFEGGKYRNYIPYDPLAIICILGSYEATGQLTENNNTIIPDTVAGNYYDTIKNVKTDNDEDINKEVQAKILASLGNIEYRYRNKEHPVQIIGEGIGKAYLVISQYIKDIIKEAENNDLKIKTIIKNNVNDFYQLFDKRDDFYISYLNKLKDSTHFKRVLYAKSIARQENIEAKTRATDYATTQKYLKYLFKYCKFLYFNENNMFAIRLLNYGIYEEDYITGTKETIKNPDEEDENNNIFSKEPTKINYNPVTVKIDAKHKNMFDDYSNAYELYKSFILTYPIILLLSIGLFIIILIAYWGNAIYVFISVLNILYILVIGIVYLFIGFMVCNSMVIKAVIFIISTAYQIIGGLYSGAMGIFNVPIIGSILKIILFLILITALLNSNLSVIYGIVMFFINTIIYIILGIISIIFYIIYGFVSLNPGIIIPSLITMSILYAYYKIWFNFDINTLHKDAKKDAKIISEHSNSETIFKSGVLKSGVGAAISMARLELYKHSYFMNLYEKAYDNYVEKIEELEGYKNNKKLLEPSNMTESEKAEQEEKKSAEITNLQNKNVEFEENVNKANIARAERREVEKELMDFDIKNDKTIKDNNMELYKNKLEKSKLNPEQIEDIKTERKKILDTKKDLLQQVRELKTSENKARGEIKPFISKNVQENIDKKKDTLSKGFSKILGENNVNAINKQGLMNMGIDKAKRAFDKIKIDPLAL